jgi:hypothetical protein
MSSIDRRSVLAEMAGEPGDRVQFVVAALAIPEARIDKSPIGAEGAQALRTVGLYDRGYEADFAPRRVRT